MSHTTRRAKTGAKQFSRHCANHGSCEYCKENRTFFDTKHRPTKKEIQDEINNWDHE